MTSLKTLLHLGHSKDCISCPLTIGVILMRSRWTLQAMHLGSASMCQSALDWDPLSASKRDPFERRVRPVALAPSELAGVAETVRARVVCSSSRLLKRQELLPV